MSIPQERLLTASRDNLISYMTALGAYVPGFALAEDNGLIRIEAAMMYPMFNRVFTTPRDLKPDSLASLIEAEKSRYEKRGASLMWVHWGEEEAPGLTERLVEGGFEEKNLLPGMGLDLTTPEEERPAIPGLAIETVTKAETFEIYKDVSARTFGLPLPLNTLLVDAIAGAALQGDGKVVSYLAYLEGEPVAITTAFLEKGVAGIYNVGTLEAARGRGIGRAITQHAVREARASGASLAVLQASKLGEPVYRGLGFEAGLTIGLYASPPPAAG
ncbi:GNAT family N-acetyltransferase [Cohnella sp. REN36]|uniref:GNAT family N-acetyltransferase n=1 Tax=Cohnella sp. REN36 TaxID=2887347 RepID=UPI001D13E8D1|nr:GNAT family N-acetyltransferase [Cohnella sp. REN36]MCC3375317.1 GNAT family N-acetyltransferase [Cohnella sp. REN36]